MATERTPAEEQQDRLERMMAEFRDARQRRLEEQGIARWNRSMTRPPSLKAILPPGKLN
jgi:hypothetical protein